jgi:subtilisin family serine protease
MDQDALKLRRSIAALLLSGALAPAALSAQDLRETAVAAPAEVEVFVQLSTQAVAEFNAAALAATGAMPDGAAQRAHAARVSQEQAGMRARLEAAGATVLSSQRVGANGLRIRVSPERVADLRNMSGVRTVGRVETHELHHTESVPWVGAPDFWTTHGLTGEGVRVGVIDTGIDYTHANFGGPGTVAAYTSNNRNVIEAGTFPTTKVVGGFDFAGPTYNANVAGSTPTPDADPIDVNGHGSHVAGSVAGLGVPGSIGQGVAPGASLYALKVFGDGGGSTNLTSLAIEWAMDPNGDGDMSDHLDVINMSLGSPFGEPNDPSAISSNNAADLGIIVVTSAGNEGDTPYVTGAPGVASKAISTAANTPGGRLSARFEVTAPDTVDGVYASLEGAGPVTFAQTGPISDSLVLANPVIGCTPLANAAAINGNIALIRRGTCGFIDKYLQAQAAGARAIVVFNDGADPTRIAPIVMGGLDARVTIPGLMISSTDGNVLAATAGVTVTLSAAPDLTDDDLIATFSSRGPGHGGSTFKPDLSAPGVAIISTGVGSGTGSRNLQGTSMASPHVAGAAALLRQQHPEAHNDVIKALLQNSTAAIVNGDRDVARHGVGALRVDAAGELSSYARPGGVSFGRINTTTAVTKVEHVQLGNLDSTNRSYTVSHVPGQTYPGVTVTCPSHASVSGNSERNVSIKLRFDPKAAAAAGRFDNGSISQSEVDGWCLLTDGNDTLRVAYMAVIDPASRVSTNSVGASTIRVRNAGPAVGIAEGFTWNNEGKNLDVDYAVRQVGFRSGDPAEYFGDPTIEFGIELSHQWEHIGNLQFDIFLDTDRDGDDDVRLVAADLSTFQDVDPGQYVTAQFTVGGTGNLDWLVVDWDFNDRVVILPWTRVGGFMGRVPDSFNYRMVVTDRSGNTDTVTGSIDFADEVTVDLNSFVVDPSDSVDVNVTGGEGYFMWLSPNDEVSGQFDHVNRPVRAAEE